MNLTRCAFSLFTFAVLSAFTLIALAPIASAQNYVVPQYGQPHQIAPANSGFNSVSQNGNQTYGNQSYELPGQSQPNFTTVSSTTSPSAVPWTQSLIKNAEHNFGVVAKASKQETIFEFENTTGVRLQLTGVRTSCGCTVPTVLTSTVGPGEIGRVKATLETHNFSGARGATLSVSVQKMGQYTEYGELQFSVKGTIRKDVVFNPGELNFQNVVADTDKIKNVRVSYAGDPNWKILDVKLTSNNLVAEAKEVARDLQTGRVDYDLVVKIGETQTAGSFSEYISIVTNDQKTTGMLFHVKGNLKSPIEASAIRLGVVNQGTKLKKKWIIRGAQPFQINELKVTNPAIKFDFVANEKTATLHILSYTLDTSEIGVIDDEITILTGAETSDETKVKFSAQVVAATVAER